MLCLAHDPVANLMLLRNLQGCVAYLYSPVFVSDDVILCIPT